MAQENNQPAVTINAQYIKDLSFENPKAPASLVAKKESPNVNISVDIKVANIENDAYEVSLVTNVTATNNDEPFFVVELTYSGIFTVQAPDADKDAILKIYCPSILFPYARRILSDTTRDGGFPPLMLDPIDFAALYNQHQQTKSDEK